MSYRYMVECFFKDRNMRIATYVGDSLWEALAAYRRAKREGGMYFLLEYRP